MTDPDSPPAVTIPWLLSAKNEPALRAQAEGLRRHLEGRSELSALDVAYSLATTRAEFDHRAVIIGGELEQMTRGLDALAESKAAPGLIRGIAAPKGKVAFLFPGQGAQRAAMGRELYESFPIFAVTLDEVCVELDQQLERPLKSVLLAPPGSVEAALLDETRFTQAGLLAFELALFALMRSWGIEPDFVIGHSMGEVVAAQVAGVLSLPDACALVAACGQLMSELPADGAMRAVEATEEEVRESLAGFHPHLSVGAVNAPASVVVSGDRQVMEEWVSVWERGGRKTTPLNVSHAFHSPSMEPIQSDLTKVANRLSFHPPRIPIVSGFTGVPITDEQACAPGYWVSQVCETVRFADGMRWLLDAGAGSFLELGPDGSLSALAARVCLSERGQVDELVVPALRAGRPELEAIMTLLARARIHGLDMDWTTLLKGGRRIELPTYSFQRRSFGSASGSSEPDVVGAGLRPLGHPFLGAAVQLAEDGGSIFTGRLSLASHPWLSEHQIQDSVLFPATAFVEVAIAVGTEVDCEVIEEMTLEVPLKLAENHATQLQTSVGPPDESGRRPFSIYSRSDLPLTNGALEEEQWTRNASGELSPGGTETEMTPLRFASESWPPRGAQPLEVNSLYDRLAERGFAFGPAFQSLRRAWKRDGDIFAELSLEDDLAAQATSFGAHPALFDGALHAQFVDVGPSVRMPFAMRAVSLRARGADSLRVRVRPSGENAVSIEATDQSGRPILSVGSLFARPISEGQPSHVHSVQHESLFRVEWTEAPATPSAKGPLGRFACLGDNNLESGSWENGAGHYTNLAELCEAISAGEAIPEVVALNAFGGEGDGKLIDGAHDVTRRLLKLLQEWIADRRFADARLVVLTEGAVVVSQDEMPQLTAAPVWGLLRSAQYEHPGRFILVDHDGEDASWQAISGALASNEPQLALREGRVFVPRLARVTTDSEGSAHTFPEPEGTILITGGTGSLGAHFARHLASTHGARHLVLASRQGPTADGAKSLSTELSELGSEVTIVACDVADRDQVRGLIGSIPDAHPLTSVIHAAGVLDDGTIETLSDEQLEAVLRPKLDAAVYLHELTADLELSEFLLFSSGTATIGGPGQGNYAAANAFLDAFAQRRRAEGLPATSLAWGLWERGMATELSGADRTRIARIGVVPLSDQEGISLFDTARTIDEPVLLPLRLDVSALQDQARSGILPALFGVVVRAAAGPAEDAAGSLVQRLAELPGGERDAAVLELVRTEAAAVLGHHSSQAIEPRRPFKELGFDSLGAVELRNGLSVATGLQLASTIAFDHPTPAALAEWLGEQFAGGDRGAILDEELDRLEASLLSVGERHGGRERVKESLRRLSAKFAEDDQTGDGAITSERMESATDNEIFELIDKEFGSP